MMMLHTQLSRAVLRPRAQTGDRRVVSVASAFPTSQRRAVAHGAAPAAAGRHVHLRLTRGRTSRVNAKPVDAGEKSLAYPETEAPPPDCKVGFDDGYGALSWHSRVTQLY